MKYEDDHEKDEKRFTKIGTDHQASYSAKVRQNVWLLFKARQMCVDTNAISKNLAY